MARTVKDLLAIKKMAYSNMNANQAGRGFGGNYSGGGGGRGRGQHGEVEDLLDRLFHQAEAHNDSTRLLQEIQYLEANLDSSFESVSFMMTSNEQRNLDCLADKDEE